MPKIKAAPVPRLNASTRKAFLAHLAETSNVAASTRFADISKSSVYAERRRLPEFRAGWAVALSEGYARLETDMLHDALKAPSAKTTDAMLKARAQKDRLRLAILSMHRASVKGAGTIAAQTAIAEPGITKAGFIAKLFQMRSGEHRKLALPNALSGPLSSPVFNPVPEGQNG